MNNSSFDIGKRLKSTRKKRNLTQLNLAQKIGLTGSLISKIESGQAELTKTVSLAIEYKTGISKNWLFTGKGKMFVITYEALKKETFDLKNKHYKLTEKDRSTILGIADVAEKLKKA